MTVKTSHNIPLGMNKVTKTILGKYKDTPLKDSKFPPNYTRQAMNRNIKVLSKLAGINEEIPVTADKILPK